MEENQNQSQPQVQPEIQSRQYKFMTNILKNAMQQTRYMKSLEKITMDAQVSYQRLMMGMFFLAVIFITYMFAGVFAGAKTLYVILWASLIMIGATILLVNFMLSSRVKSMLTTSITLIMLPILESVRKKAKRAGDLKSIGIKNMKDGIIYFKNGDVGVAYEIDGVLSSSTLPYVADAVADEKARYLVARPATSQEQMIVSVKEIDTRSQRRQLRQYASTQTKDEVRDAWVKFMAETTDQYIAKYINSEYTVIEHLILRDVDLQSLQKAIVAFENAANAGMYAKITRLMTRKEIVTRFGSLAMLSKGGLVKYARDEE